MSEELVRKAIEVGNVRFSENAVEAIANMNLDNPDFALTKVEATFWGPFDDLKGRSNKGGVNFQWMSKSAGCGRICIWMDNDGSLHCYNQGMDKKFIKEVFAHFLDQVKFD